MKKIRLNIQKFASEGEVMTFDEILKDPVYQSAHDKKVDDAINTAKSNWEKDIDLENLKSYQTKYEEVNGKLQDYETTQKIEDFGVKKEFAKFVKSEVQGLVTDKVDFDNALKTYVESNPQYKAVTETVKKDSSPSLTGKTENPKSAKEKMNESIVSALKK